MMDIPESALTESLPPDASPQGSFFPEQVSGRVREFSRDPDSLAAAVEARTSRVGVVQTRP